MAAATPGEGVKSQATTPRAPAGRGLGGRPGAAALMLAWLAACGPPTVDARAVWIASERDKGGARTLTIYDAGRLVERELLPADPGPKTDALPLVVELDPRGQGALVRAADGGWQHGLGDSQGILRAGYVDLVGERTLPLALPAGLAPDAAGFAPAGGALWWTAGCPAALQLVPLSPQVATPSAGDPAAVVPLAWPLPTGCAEVWGAVGAADAPVVFVVQGVPEDGFLRPGPNGHVLSLMYPKPADGYAAAPALTELAAARLPDVPLARLQRVRCAGPGPSCGLGAADPDGRALSLGGADGACRVWRWAVGEPEAACAVAAGGPEWTDASHLIAAISPRHYVFRDGLVIRRYDHTTGEHDGRPLIGDTGELFTRVSADGRALLFITTRGAALRVDEARLELLSAEQSPCVGGQPPVASPNARFVAWTCVSDTQDVGGVAAGEIVRVSSAGMERFQGVPMWALAIDDDGDLLLHSRDDQDFSLELLLPPAAPRNLYVLSADGELARIDALEPDPELMRGAGTAVFRWIAAQSIGSP
ncbi:hypothetical protein [Nannocystis punicea]|uniref:WD40 repeat protein n=1 Tax=Nannocystis punicea TaxID=2995304 RepID=A0ABY7HJV9_9BACT|nr:hypothetical protein [Nannocystis poenicansa]WAS99408.1 hypothetical protein O0S08_25050 [Nannocystis poenicansa]